MALVRRSQTRRALPVILLIVRVRARRLDAPSAGVVTTLLLLPLPVPVPVLVLVLILRLVGVRVVRLFLCRRALLMPQFNPGSLYRCGKRT